MKAERRCPFFKRKIHSYRYKGIKCSSDNYPNSVIGSVSLWGLEKRDSFFSEYCNGDYEECGQYKNHIRKQ